MSRMTDSRLRAKRAGRLSGSFEYQHHVGARYLIELLAPKDDAIETIIESDDGSSLDDVVQRRRNETEYVQVKWGADRPPKPFGVVSLTEDGQKSLIAKMARGVILLSGRRRVVLWTNRPPGVDLAALLQG